MLTHIGVASENAFILPIHGLTPKDSLLLRSVTGLNPPDINLFIGEFSRDGGFYQGRRVGNRNVVMTIDLNPNPALGETVQGWRDILYRTFIDPQIIGDYIRLDLYDDSGRKLYVVGYTEKFETDLFGQTTVQISMICPDPYIRQDGITTMTSETGWISVPFVYVGTAETGFEIETSIEVNSVGLTLTNNGRSMALVHDFTVGEVVYINTNRGSRKILKALQTDVDAASGDTLSEKWSNLEADELTTSLLAAMTPASRWLELHSQSNSMSIYGDALSDGNVVIKALEYQNSYWGV